MDDELTVDNDVLECFGFVRFCVFGFVEEPDEDLGSRGALLEGVLLDGGHRWCFEIAGDGQVGVADEADILTDL